MKKQLLSVTAIVAVGMLGLSGSALAKAQRPALSIGGYSAAGWTYADNGSAGDNNTGGLHAIWDAEIFFRVAGRLDNGVRLAARMDLEAGAADEGNYMDDTWLSMSGKFGQVILGMTDGAHARVAIGQIGDWAVGVYSMTFERGEMVPAPSGFAMTGPNGGLRASAGDTDDTKTTWISPTWGGFQFGLSYMRDVGAGNDTINAQTTGQATGEDWYSFGARWTGRMGSSRVGVGLGSVMVTEPSLNDESSAVMLGANLENGPWKVAVGLMAEDDPLTATGASTDGQAWSAGVRYVRGAHRYSIALYHGKSSADPTVTGDDESTSWMLAHNYAVSQGVTWRNALTITEYDGEGTGAAEDHRGMGVHSSVNFSF